MSKDKVHIENPTSETQSNTEIMNVIDQQLSFVETFLREFCKVHNFGENELRQKIQVLTYPPEGTILVVDAENNKNVKFGITSHLKTSEKKFLVNFEVFGEFIHQKENYPETLKALNDGDTGNTTITSGE